MHNAGQVKILQMIGPHAIAQSPFLYQQFLSVRNTAVSTPADSFDLADLASFCLHQFTFGVLERRHIPFGEPEWLYLTSTTALVDPWVAITDAFCEVPALQESLDACEAETRGPRIDHAVGALLHLERRLVEWRRQYQSELSPRGPWIVNHRHLRYVKDLTPPAALTQVYRFSDFRVALLNILFWGLRWDLLRVRNALVARDVEVPASPLHAVRVGESHVECGLQMARSAAFCCQSRFGSAGRIGTLVGLKYAAGAFLSEGHHEEAQWCSLLAAHIKENSICQPPLWKIYA